MELKIYDKQGTVKMTVSPDNSSQWNHEVGVENVVTVNFTTWEFLVLEVGWYILVEGQRFSIKSEYRPKHIHDTKYTYNLKFYGREHDAQDILFCRLNQGEDDLESVFAYDGTPMDFLQKVVANMNRNTDGVEWKAGEAISANRQPINFNGLYCWDALGEIARAFGTEWWMDGEYLNISKCERGESVSLGYGHGLKSGLTQNENTNAVKWFTRLIPVGSSKNIDKNKYGYATLQLPGREKYIDINTQYGLKEYREEAAFSEIYPHRVGTISSVRSEERTNEETGNYTVYYVKDSSLPFNPDEYMIGGEVIHMTFNSGALAGKDFEVNWNNETKEFEIINQYPDENTQLPGGNLVPSADDTYVLWNISMPDEYIRAAEQELKTAVDVYLAEYSKDISVYSGSTDYIYISKNDVPLLLGQRVRLLSEVYFGNIGRDSRITRVSRKLNNLNEATIDCSDAIASSWKSSVDSSLNQLQFAVSNEMAQALIQILKTGESGTPSDYNVLSALRSLNTFLRKDKDDRSKGKISSDKGFEAGDFVNGATGVAIYKNSKGQWVVETDNLNVRRKFSANDVEIQSTEHIGGQSILTPARMIVELVDIMDDRYRCLFRKKDGDGNVVRNQWKEGDLALCNTFNLELQADGTTGNHYYWREVVGVSDDSYSDIYHYVDLSIDSCALESSVPKVGDKVVQLGYCKNDDPDRQNAIIIAGAGVGSPYIQIFEGIHTFELPEPEQLKPGDNRLSGVLQIKSGSKGWENLDGLSQGIKDAVDLGVEHIEYGKNNLLMNSGFTGDYVTATLSGNDKLDESSQMYSPSLKYWESVNAVAQESSVSESSKEVSISDGGSLSQMLYYKIVAQENYVVSFRAIGKCTLSISVGGYSYSFNIDNETEWDTFIHKFVAKIEGQIFSISVVGSCQLCELQLEKGTNRSAWGASPLDNRSELAKYESLTYMTDAIKNGSSDFAGGLGLMNMLFMKNNQEKITAGTSGIYNDDDSVAYFAGGDYAMAINTVMAYSDSPNYQPTNEELQNLAKFVVTHGGRAILNDVILRGYIYALGGYFKGEINAVKGVFKNIKSPNDAFSIKDDGTASFLSGIIGQFIIDDGNIGIRSGDENIGYKSLMALMRDSILFQEEGRRCVVGTKSATIESGKSSMCDLSFNFTDDLFPNKCITFDVQGSKMGNFAFAGKGSGVLSGLNLGYGVKVIEGKSTDLNKLGSLEYSNLAVNTYIALPTLGNAYTSLGITEGNFIVPLYVFNTSTTDDIYVYGKNYTYNGMDSPAYPKGDRIKITAGSSATIYLKHIGENYTFSL